MTDYIKPQGRRTIRQGVSAVPNPMIPAGRQPRSIRMWDIGDGAPGSFKEKLRTVYHASLGAVDRVGARKDAAIKSGKFTPDGAADDALQFVLSDAVPTFRRGRDAIKAAKREASALKDKIKLEPSDKTDVVGYMRRQEMRGWLRGLKNEDRNHFISKNRDNLDPELALAIVELPSEFSGVMEGDRNGLLDHALRAQHGEAMKELGELEHAIEIAESAVEAGRDEARLETGLDARAFDERAAPIEAKSASFTPWLRHREKDGAEQVVVMDLNKRIERPATAEEITSGAFFKDFAEFQTSNPDFAAQAAPSMFAAA